MKQKMTVFSDEFKFKVAREYMETDCSQVELRKKYKIRGKGNISAWVRKFGLQPEPLIKRQNSPREYIMQKGKQKSVEEKALEKKVKELKKLLDYEKMRSDALDTMIEIAEDKFKIAIRKKSGTKQ